VGPGARFVGEISGEEDVVVLGHLEGTIRVGGRATVGPGGDVEGDVHARTVIVQGRVHGKIFGGERAELTATAVVEGSVEAPKIIIAEGARLEGSVAMAPRGEASAPRTSEG
jgi:cytoskeletal protein CcmA (bactofilin family)